MSTAACAAGSIPHEQTVMLCIFRAMFCTDEVLTVAGTMPSGYAPSRRPWLIYTPSTTLYPHFPRSQTHLAPRYAPLLADALVQRYPGLTQHMFLSGSWRPLHRTWQVSSPLSVQRYGMSDTDLSCAAARHAKTTSAEMCCITPGPGILPVYTLLKHVVS